MNGIPTSATAHPIRRGKRILHGSRAGARAAAAFFGVAMLAATAVPAAAFDTAYPEDGDHPLRIVAYFVQPVGELLERTVTRPLAALGSSVPVYEHIDDRPFKGCSRERPARSCTSVVK